MRKICCLLICLFSILLSCFANEKKYKAVIITGQNNHNWPVSSVAIEKILENSNLFEADIAISPQKGEPMEDFNVNFSDYDVVVLDYNGDYWSDQMQHDFVKYIQNGGGLVIYHAANNSFPEWEEFNKITAFGGWRGRNQKSGPYIYMEDKKVVYDHTTPGNAGSHGPQHEYVMEMIKKNHPITKGMPTRWRHAKDELYAQMRGPGKIKDPLYSSYSAKEMSGTGKDELMIFTVDYGKARIFHMTLGHVGSTLENNPSMQCTGFQVFLLRGTEWAASGKVTQKLPADFPTEKEVSYRMNYR